MTANALRKIAWVYAAGFLGIFLITHAPFLTDENGLSFGLFKIDPIDDIVHLLSGIAGVIVAGWATNYVRLFLQLVGILYMGDAIVGMTTTRGLLDGSIFTQGPGAADFGMTNWALNLPHIVLSGLALIVGFRRKADAPRMERV